MSTTSVSPWLAVDAEWRSRTPLALSLDEEFRSDPARMSFADQVTTLIELYEDEITDELGRTTSRTASSRSNSETSSAVSRRWKLFISSSSETVPASAIARRSTYVFV